MSSRLLKEQVLTAKRTAGRSLSYMKIIFCNLIISDSVQHFTKKLLQIPFKVAGCPPKRQNVVIPYLSKTEGAAYWLAVHVTASCYGAFVVRIFGYLL